MSENILCVKNIKKSFGGVHALKGVDLTIKKGETHCLAGENGCGKSTIIKVISGFYKPDEGTIEIDGKEYTNMSNTSGVAGIIFACVVALVVGALCGIFNGFLVSFLNIPPMLATLGSYELYMGISIVLSKGSTVSANGQFNILSAMTIFGIPLPFILFIICTIILTWIMSKTSFGNKVYLVGTNAKSAKFAGINVKKTTLCCYMISGILSAVAGLVSLSRLNSAKADFGTSYTMQTILVAVLGGINPDGGFGNIPGIAFAVIILQTLSSYLNQFPAISNYYRDMIWGIALLAVLVFNIYISKRRAKKAASK